MSPTSGDSGHDSENEVWLDKFSGLPEDEPDLEDTYAGRGEEFRPVAQVRHDAFTPQIDDPALGHTISDLYPDSDADKKRRRRVYIQMMLFVIAVFAVIGVLGFVLG